VLRIPSSMHPCRGMGGGGWMLCLGVALGIKGWGVGYWGPGVGVLGIGGQGLGCWVLGVRVGVWLYFFKNFLETQSTF
jgi:hypothetical protein